MQPQPPQYSRSVDGARVRAASCLGEETRPESRGVKYFAPGTVVTFMVGEVWLLELQVGRMASCGETSMTEAPNAKIGEHVMSTAKLTTTFCGLGFLVVCACAVSPLYQVGDASQALQGGNLSAALCGFDATLRESEDVEARRIAANGLAATTELGHRIYTYRAVHAPDAAWAFRELWTACRVQCPQDLEYACESNRYPARAVWLERASTAFARADWEGEQSALERVLELEFEPELAVQLGWARWRVALDDGLQVLQAVGLVSSRVGSVLAVFNELTGAANLVLNELSSTLAELQSQAQQLNNERARLESQIAALTQDARSTQYGQQLATDYQRVDRSFQNTMAHAREIESTISEVRSTIQDAQQVSERLWAELQVVAGLADRIQRLAVELSAQDLTSASRQAVQAILDETVQVISRAETGVVAEVRYYLNSVRTAVPRWAAQEAAALAGDDPTAQALLGLAALGASYAGVDAICDRIEWVITSELAELRQGAIGYFSTLIAPDPAALFAPSEQDISRLECSERVSEEELAALIQLTPVTETVKRDNSVRACMQSFRSVPADTIGFESEVSAVWRYFQATTYGTPQ